VKNTDIAPLFHGSGLRDVLYRGVIPALAIRSENQVSVASIKQASDAAAPAPATARSAAEGGDFAAVARDVAAQGAAPDVPAAASAPATRSDGISALAAMLAMGDLAGARAALAQLGVHATFGDEAHEATHPQPGTKIATATPAQPSATNAAQANAAAATQKVVDAGSATTASDVDVHQVLLALATGNANGLPAEIINLYGPGGARYDPAAIMDAYRSSAIGHAQMAALAWIGKPA
jgi:hypothetical protein